MTRLVLIGYLCALAVIAVASEVDPLIKATGPEFRNTLDALVQNPITVARLREAPVSGTSSDDLRRELLRQLVLARADASEVFESFDEMISLNRPDSPMYPKGWIKDPAMPPLDEQFLQAALDRTHADGEVSMPDEAIAATQMVQDRDVKGNTEINGPDRYGIGYALRGNMNVAGFLAKVYRPKILNVGYAIVKLPGDPAIMGEPLSKIGHGIKKILRQAAVRIDFIDFGTVIVDYDTDGDGVLDATGPNALVEWRKILTALQARPSFNSAERIICYVNGFDDPYADGGLQNPVLLPHMCFVKLSGVTSVFNENWTERDAAHELCHTLGLNEYNPSTEAQSESAEENAEDIENLMWSPLPKPTDYALLLTGHLRPWQWDIINGHVTE